ncbi:MAG: hypothetical protein QXG00_07315 [Candidatus Woesearchaeota archaeon]
MGIIIGVNSLEKNVGVSTTSLTLAERISKFSDLSVCVVDLDKKNPELSLIVEQIRFSTINIDNIMTYLSLNDIPDDINGVIEASLVKFKNSKVSCIYGSRLDRDFSTRQYLNFFKIIKHCFDIIIIDFGVTEIKSTFMEDIDLHILIFQSSFKFFEKLKRNAKMYITKNTVLLLNHYDKKLTNLKRALIQEYKSVKIIGELPSSNYLNTKIIHGDINIDKGNYSYSLSKVSERIIKELGLKMFVKKKGLFGKIETYEENVYVKEYSEPLLGDILLEMGAINEKQLAKALQKQKAMTKIE